MWPTCINVVLYDVWSSSALGEFCKVYDRYLYIRRSYL